LYCYVVIETEWSYSKVVDDFFALMADALMTNNNGVLH